MSSSAAGLSASFTFSRMRVAQISSGAQRLAPSAATTVRAHPPPRVVAREHVAARQAALEHRLQRVERALDLLARPAARGSPPTPAPAARSQANTALSDSTLSSGQQSITTGPGTAPRCVQRLPQPGDDVDALAEQRVELGEFEVRRAQHDAAARDLRDIVERPLAHEEAVDRVVGAAAAGRRTRATGAPCGSRSMASGRCPRCAIAGEQVERGRRLADAALLVEDRDDCHGAEDSALVRAVQRFAFRAIADHARTAGRLGVSCTRLPMTSPLQPSQFVVMAAGQGKRMHSALPKVLHPLGGPAAASRTCSTPRATLAPRAHRASSSATAATRCARRSPRPTSRFVAAGPAARHRRRGRASRSPRCPRDGVTLVADRRLPAHSRRRRSRRSSRDARGRAPRAADGAGAATRRARPHRARRRRARCARSSRSSDATPASARSTRSTPA